MAGVILQGVGDPVQLEGLSVEAVKGGQYVRVAPKLPAVILCDPKDGYNVGNAQRACANWGVGQLWWTGDRVSLGKVDVADVIDSPKVKARQTPEDRKAGRLPREERMKGWASVELINHARPFDFYTRLSPKPRIICVELLKGAQHLFHYQHPQDAVYVFGPEDGSVPDYARHLCHERLMAPTAGCMNLAAAVNVVLAFRLKSLIDQGLVEDKPVDQFLTEHRGVL
jgi:tRNA(Leu) C34 or U34 (ribose-2'-O)-methylase TrmL